MNEIIIAENLCKSYAMGGHVIDVLKDASLTVQAGETVAIVGSSGSGKSTLLHIIGGLDRPDRGSVTVEQTDIYKASGLTRTRLRARKIGFVFQAYHLLPELTVLENTFLPAMSGSGLAHTESEIHSRAASLLSSVGLSDRSDHRPMELSGGEQQRLAVARALMNDPHIVLADEPTGNLDKATGGHVLDHVFDLVRQRNRTLIIVTHDQEVAARCDRTLHLRDGMVE